MKTKYYQSLIINYIIFVLLDVFSFRKNYVGVLITASFSSSPLFIQPPLTFYDPWQFVQLPPPLYSTPPVYERPKSIA